jgi:hypothetical protein
VSGPGFPAPADGNPAAPLTARGRMTSTARQSASIEASQFGVDQSVMSRGDATFRSTEGRDGQTLRQFSPEKVRTERKAVGGNKGDKS